MTEDQIISASVDTFLEKEKYSFTVAIAEPKRSLWAWIKRKPLQTERTFTIYPCKAANMARIAGVAVRMPNKLDGGTKEAVYLPLIVSHMDDVLYTVAAGIQNNKHEPNPALIEFLRDNADAIDLYKAAYFVLENVNMESFFNTIVLIKGSVTIIKKETSPVDRSE
jgi:hypothetical protein